MKFILSASAFVLFTVVAVSAQETCETDARNAIKRHNDATSRQLADGVAIEKRAASAANAHILATQAQNLLDAEKVQNANHAVKDPSPGAIASWATKAASVQAEQDTFIANLRAAEASRKGIAATATAVTAANAAARLAELNADLAAC